MRFDRIIIAACILFALAACKNEKPVYVTVNEEFDIVVDNTTESVRVVIEGGFNPHVKQVVSNADWLKADYLGTIKLGEFKDPETGFYWLSGGEYPQFELSYTTYEYLDEYDERDTDVVITTESGNTLTLHVTQGERILRIDDEKPNYCFVPTEQGVMMVLNTGGGMGGPKLSDIKSVNTDFEADWTKEEAIYLFDGKGPEVVNNILQSIAKIQDNIVQSFYIKECARLFEIPEASLGSKLRSILWKNKSERKKGEQAPAEEVTPLQEVQIREQQQTEQIKPQVDLLYEAEKNLLILLLKYGFYEIVVKDPNAEDGVAPKRVDQYIYDELYNDGLVLQNPLLRKIYDHYAEKAEILKDFGDLQRSFVYSEDKEESQFVLDNLEWDDYEYSELWEKKYDMYTRYASNNIQSLQQEVESTLLSLKLRIVENQIEFLNKELKREEYEEEDVNNIIQNISLLNQCRKNISERLNRVVSR